MDKFSCFLEYIKEASFDAFMLNGGDEYLDEFTPCYLNRLKFLTGFTGSNGVAIISNQVKAFFTDGRYLVQARQELGSDFEIFDLAYVSIQKWISENFQSKSKIAYDSKAFTIAQIRKINKFLQNYDIKLYRVTENPIDALFDSTGKTKDFKQIEILDERYTSLSVKDKIKDNRLLSSLTGKQGFFTCDTASICWILNIRGKDVKFSPLLHSYFLYNKRLSFLFCDSRKFTNEHREYLEEFKIKVVDIAKVKDFANICKENKIKQVFLDPNYVGYYFYSVLVKQQIEIIKVSDPIVAQKSVKNQEEILGAKKAHILDGVAKTKFLYWLSNQEDLSQFDELSIAEKLLSFRKEQQEFCYPSFNTISAFAENSSIIHYNPSRSSNKKLDKDSLLLLDSGGQYKCGTTDVTRVVAVGKNIHAEYQRNYTLVLKGHIALAMAVFPEKTSGIQLDVLARQYLWQEFKDYAHGTGHGVGSFLNVHEGPQNISKNYNGVSLKAGMILSNEPGIYLKDQYGIRIENVMLVNQEACGFLSFETISLVPLEEKLIDFSLLTNKEKNWLRNYHKKIYDNLSPYLPPEINSWLQAKVEP